MKNLVWGIITDSGFRRNLAEVLSCPLVPRVSRTVRFIANARIVAKGLQVVSGVVSITVLPIEKVYASSLPYKDSDPQAKNKSLLLQKPKPKSNPEHIQIHKSKMISGGGGMFASSNAPHSVQAVTKEYMNMRSPSSSPLDFVQTLPSMNVSTPDPTGMRGGDISIRGLGGSEMGVLLNGVNQVSPSVGFITEVSDSENLQSVQITPGSSAVDIPVTSAAAGVMNIIQSDPTKQRSGLMDFTYGSNNLSREFIRLDTGEIGNTGVSSFFSFSHASAHSWIGVGDSDRRHIDFGLQKLWANGSSWKVHTSWTGEQYTQDNYPDEQQFKNYKHNGVGWGHSQTCDLGTSGGDNCYKADPYSSNQLYVSAPLHLHLSRRVSFDLNPYLNFGRWWAAGGTEQLAGAGVYGADGNSVANQYVTTTLQGNQGRTVGAVAKINYKIDKHNDLTFGYWYQNDIDQYAEVTTLVQPNGAVINPNYGPNKTYVHGIDGQLHNNQNSYNPGNELHSLFVQERAHYFHDKLQVMAGFKYVMSNFWYKQQDPQGNKTNLGYNQTAPLPQFSMSYKFNSHHQMYINAEGDFRQPDPQNLTLQPGQGLPKSEYSIKEELGYRYNHRLFMIDLSFFNYNITNKLYTECLNNQCSVKDTGNMGSISSRGFDAIIAGHPWHHISPYASIEYLHATIDSNTKWGDSYLPTKGLEAFHAPHVMANFGLSYVTSSLFGNFGMHYAGPQSADLMNDQRMPGYVTDNLSLGYHFHSLNFAHAPTLRLNFTNLTGAIVRTGINGMSINKNPVTLINGQQGPGATSGASFFAVPRFSMSGTLSAGF